MSAGIDASRGDHLAARLYGPRDVRIESRRGPMLSGDEVAVGMVAVGLCGSDMHYYVSGRNGPNKLRAPCILGHEGIGVVLHSGGSVGAFAVGARVAIEPAVGCGSCGACRAGRYNICASPYCLGSPPVDGLLDERVAVASASLHLLPDALSDDGGVLVEPAAVAVHAVRRGRVSLGDTVLVVGLGTIGLLVGVASLRSGAASVVAADVDERKLARAARVGMSGAISGTTEALKVSADVVFECSGTRGGLLTAVAGVGSGGTVVLVGTPPLESPALPLSSLARAEVTVVTSFRSANAFPAAICLLKSCPEVVMALIGTHYPFASTAEAFARASSGKDDGKVIIDLC